MWAIKAMQHTHTITNTFTHTHSYAQINTFSPSTLKVTTVLRGSRNNDWNMKYWVNAQKCFHPRLMVDKSGWESVKVNYKKHNHQQQNTRTMKKIYPTPSPSKEIPIWKAKREGLQTWSPSFQPFFAKPLKGLCLWVLPSSNLCRLKLTRLYQNILVSWILIFAHRKNIFCQKANIKKLEIHR